MKFEGGRAFQPKHQPVVSHPKGHQLIYNNSATGSILTSLHAPSEQVAPRAGDHGKHSSIFLQLARVAWCKLTHMPWKKTLGRIFLFRFLHSHRGHS